MTKKLTTTQKQINKMNKQFIKDMKVKYKNMKTYEQCKFMSDCLERNSFDLKEKNMISIERAIEMLKEARFLKDKSYSLKKDPAKN